MKGTSPYWAVLSARYLSLLQYRAAALAGAGTQFFWGFIRIMILLAFYQSSSESQPMDFADVVTYVWLGQALLALLPWNHDLDLERQIRDGGMDRKWMPDFVRVVEDFEYTGTQKILVRNLKAAHFDAAAVTDPLYWRERGDETFKPFTPEDYASLRAGFEAAERVGLLDRK